MTYGMGEPNLEVAANHITETFHVPEAGFILINNQQTALIKLFTGGRKGYATRITLDKLCIDFKLQLLNSATYHCR